MREAEDSVRLMPTASAQMPLGATYLPAHRMRFVAVESAHGPCSTASAHHRIGHPCAQFPRDL